MEENLRDSIYWHNKFDNVNREGVAACKEVIKMMGQEHGSAAQRLAIDIYRRHGLIISSADEAQRAPEDFIQCQTPNSH